MARALASALAVLLLGLAPAAAAPRSISDCESIKEADAYNRCLAEFGPAARTGGVSRDVPAGADPAPAAAAQEGAPRASGRAGGRAKPPWLAARQAEGRRRMMERRKGIVTERRGGRVRAIIDMKRK